MDHSGLPPPTASAVCGTDTSGTTPRPMGFRAPTPLICTKIGEALSGPQLPMASIACPGTVLSPLPKSRAPTTIRFLGKTPSADFMRPCGEEEFFALTEIG